MGRGEGREAERREGLVGDRVEDSEGGAEVEGKRDEGVEEEEEAERGGEGADRGDDAVLERERQQAAGGEREREEDGGREDEPAVEAREGEAEERDGRQRGDGAGHERRPAVEVHEEVGGPRQPGQDRVEQRVLEPMARLAERTVAVLRLQDGRVEPRVPPAVRRPLEQHREAGGRVVLGDRRRLRFTTAPAWLVESDRLDSVGRLAAHRPQVHLVNVDGGGVVARTPGVITFVRHHCYCLRKRRAT